MNKKWYVAALLVLALVLSACGGDGGDDAVDTPTDEANGGEAEGEDAAGEEPSLDFVGPNGESPTSAEELQLTDEEMEEIRDGGYTAALVWHENSAFIQAVEQGVREQLDELGVEVVATTAAEFDAARQADNVSAVLAREPDIIITIAVDPTAAAEAFRPAVDAGVKIVVLTTPPADYTAGEEIVGIVTGELTGYGKAAAEMLGEEVGGQGEVGWLYHDADFWFTNQRDQAFVDWLNYLYPDMEIVAEEGFSDPARTEDIASAMLTRHADLTGIYVAWATAAEGVLSALRAAGRDDIKVVTNDLDAALATDMMQGGNVAGIVANPAVDTGRKLAVMAGYGVLDKEAPELAVVTPLGVTPDNIEEGWRTEFAEDPPADVTG